MIEENINLRDAFGDSRIIGFSKQRVRNNPEKSKITIDLKMLMKAGLDKHQAIDLMKKLIQLKK